MLQEISALCGVIQIQQMESAALRRELEISRLASPAIASGNSAIRRNLVRSIKGPVYQSNNQLRKRQFSWKLIAELIPTYRRSIDLNMLNEGDITNHIKNLKPGIYAVLDSAKDRLRSEIGTLRLAEEEFGNEEASLGVCVGHWGAQLILANFWNNKKDVEDDETDSSSSEDSSCNYILIRFI
ncbi:hypothetical protein G6F56_008220 [Rhizopus delemar]|nr:hypothetical protein G6F56_008220 [Rhizopus delemar]